MRYDILPSQVGEFEFNSYTCLQLCFPSVDDGNLWIAPTIKRWANWSRETARPADNGKGEKNKCSGNSSSSQYYVTKSEINLNWNINSARGCRSECIHYAGAAEEGREIVKSFTLKSQETRITNNPTSATFQRARRECWLCSQKL